MAYLIGTFLTLAIFVFAFWIGLDRDRAFYPTVMLVIASYYDLFGAMGGSTPALVKETLVTLVFVGVAVLGFKRNLWLVVAAMVGHAVFDFLHEHVVTNPGMPPWWPAFCLSSDLAAGAFLAWRLLRTPRLAA
ncbi:MAG: hypothetical protein ABIZ04_23475 [Opitutus sp.]